MFLPYLPSVTAASAICLANLMLGSADPWVRVSENCAIIVKFVYIVVYIDLEKVDIFMPLPPDTVSKGVMF